MQPMLVAEGWRAEADSGVPAQVASECSHCCCWCCSHRSMAADLIHEATMLMHSSSARQPCIAGGASRCREILHSLCGELAATLTLSKHTDSSSCRMINYEASKQLHHKIRPSRPLSEHHLPGQIFLMSQQHPRLQSFEMVNRRHNISGRLCNGCWRNRAAPCRA